MKLSSLRLFLTYPTNNCPLVQHNVNEFFLNNLQKFVTKDFSSDFEELFFIFFLLLGKVVSLIHRYESSVCLSISRTGSWSYQGGIKVNWRSHLTEKGRRMQIEWNLRSPQEWERVRRPLRHTEVVRFVPRSSHHSRAMYRFLALPNLPLYLSVSLSFPLSLSLSSCTKFRSASTVNSTGESVGEALYL